jgi:hypothetical protein
MSKFDNFCNLILEAYGKIIVSATGTDKSGKTEVTYSDGSKATLTGKRPVRNNNPGNLEYGDFSKKHGAVGSDGRYAVFPDVQTGTQAQIALLKLPKYQNLSLIDAIHRYAPPSEGNNANYPRELSQATGIPLDTKLSSLSPDQFSNMVNKMQKIEGFNGGGINVTPNQQYASAEKQPQQTAQTSGEQSQQTAETTPVYDEDPDTNSLLSKISNIYSKGITADSAKEALKVAAGAGQDIFKKYSKNT